jgi:hypothetical protein
MSHATIPVFAAGTEFEALAARHQSGGGSFPLGSTDGQARVIPAKVARFNRLFVVAQLSNHVVQFLKRDKTSSVSQFVLIDCFSQFHCIGISPHCRIGKLASFHSIGRSITGGTAAVGENGGLLLDDVFH